MEKAIIFRCKILTAGATDHCEAECSVEDAHVYRITSREFTSAGFCAQLLLLAEKPVPAALPHTTSHHAEPLAPACKTDPSETVPQPLAATLKVASHLNACWILNTLFLAFKAFVNPQDKYAIGK